MKLQRYLNEKYFDTMQYRNGEIFKNPSKKELKELGSQYGYRYFIDLKNKNVYIGTAETFHKTMLDTSEMLRKELGMDWRKYWIGDDKTNSYIIMGDCNSHMRYANSDAITDLAFNNPSKKLLKNLRKMLSYDFTWLSKYGFDPVEIIRVIERGIDQATGRESGNTKFREYVLEKYTTSLKLGGYGEIIDIFKNPNSKELKEIQSQSYDEYGFRFLVDFEKNDVYVWSNMALHRWIVEKNPQLFPDLKWNDYFMKADQADRYFSGHLEHGQIKSDVWRALAHRAMAGQFTPEEINTFERMRDNDKKWLSKHGIDPKGIQRYVDNVIRQYEKVQRRAS